MVAGSELSFLMSWANSGKRHQNVSIRDGYSPEARRILAFAEWLELAKSRRQRAPSITTGLHPKTDIKLPMSAFPRFTSGIGSKAAVIREG